MTPLMHACTRIQLQPATGIQTYIETTIHIQTPLSAKSHLEAGMVPFSAVLQTSAVLPGVARASIDSVKESTERP